MKIIRGIVTGLLVIGVSACASAPKSLTNIPLEWKPTSTVKLPPGSLDKIVDTKIQIGSFKDVRQKPELIAENNEDPVAKPVTTKDDVGAFVMGHLKDFFDSEGLKTVDSGGDVVISGEVRQFYVNETTVYKGEVVLRVVVHNQNGKSLWSGAAEGTATTFGHSYKAENYYEVLSDSVLSAAGHLLQDPAFQEAIARK